MYRASSKNTQAYFVPALRGMGPVIDANFRGTEPGQAPIPHHIEIV